jgi:hypothetical protein
LMGILRANASTGRPRVMRRHRLPNAIKRSKARACKPNFVSEYTDAGLHDYPRTRDDPSA